jgi:hypothetical protein
MGALLAAGHALDEILDLTWSQIQIASQAVRLYHSDLAASLLSGKSPTLQDAYGWVNKLEAGRMMMESMKELRPDLSESDARTLAQEQAKLQEIARAGIAVHTEPKHAPVDLFALARGLKANGAAGEKPND